MPRAKEGVVRYMATLPVSLSRKARREAGPRGMNALMVVALEHELERRKAEASEGKEGA